MRTVTLTALVRRVRETKSLDEFSALCREEGFLFGSPYVTLRLGKSRQDPEKFGIYFEPVQLVPTKQSQEDEPDPDAPVAYDTASVEKELLELGFTPERAKDLAERLETVQRRTDTAEILQDELADKPLTPAELRTVCTPIYDQMVSQGMVTSDGGITAVDLLGRCGPAAPLHGGEPGAVPGHRLPVHAPLCAGLPGSGHLCPGP